MNELLIIIALVNGHFDFSHQKIKDGLCFQTLSIVQKASQFVFKNANSGKVLGGCHILKTNKDSTGDETGKHNLNIHAMASGNYTSAVMVFRNKTACELAERGVENIGKILLKDEGDSGALEGSCVPAEDD